jgi:hypothetical protein
MNGRFQMQGGKNGILPKETNENRFYCDSHWLEIWSSKPLMSLYGTEWREPGYGHRSSGLKERHYLDAAKLRCMPSPCRSWRSIKRLISS